MRSGSTTSMVSHSGAIVSASPPVAMNVGFYYMANAMGRLLGTVLSGWVYQAYGLPACLWVSCAFLLATACISVALPRHNTPSA